MLKHLLDSLVIIQTSNVELLPFSFLNGEDIQDEGVGGYQGGDKDREDEDGEQEDTGSDKLTKLTY